MAALKNKQGHMIGLGLQKPKFVPQRLLLWFEALPTPPLSRCSEAGAGFIDSVSHN